MKIGLLSHTVFALLLVAATANPIPSAEPVRSTCGDIDNNGLQNVNDIVYFNNYLFVDGPPPPDPWTANFGGCAGINIHDLQHFIDYSFAGAGPGTCDLDTACTPQYYGAISIDSVTGLLSADTILTGCTPRFSIRLTNSTDWRVPAMTTGFRVYSPDGAEWDSTVLALTAEFPDTSAPVSSYFDGGVYTRHFNCDGAGADTVGVGAFRLFMSGMAIGYDAVGLTVDIGPISMGSVGRTICIDSCWYPPGGDWLWQHRYGGYPPSTPTWSGERCFTVAACRNYRGDMTLSDGINVSDLTYLVAHLFQGGPGAVCFEVGDVDGDLSGPNVSDLTYLVAFLFQGGDPPPGC